MPIQKYFDFSLTYANFTERLSVFLGTCRVCALHVHMCLDVIMRVKKMKSNLLLTTSLMTAALFSYGRQASAGMCFGPNPYLCYGDIYGAQNFYNTDPSVFILSDANIDSQGDSDPAIEVTGDGDILVQSDLGSKIYSEYFDTEASEFVGGDGIRIEHLGVYGDLEGADGSIVADINSEITAFNTAINISNNSYGDVTLTSTGNISGGGGIEVVNSEYSGALSITLGAGNTTGTYSDGINAQNYGTGALTITGGSGAVSGAEAGIYAENRFDDLIITVSGGVSGSNGDGIHAENRYASGVVSETYIEGQYFPAYYRDGYYVDSYTYPGYFFPGYEGDPAYYYAPYTVGGYFVDPINQPAHTTDGYFQTTNGAATGALTIITGDGDISGGVDGIYVLNEGTGDLTVTGGSGSITGDDDGIHTVNYNSDMVIEVSGDVGGVEGSGIYALNGGGFEGEGYVEPGAGSLIAALLLLALLGEEGAILPNGDGGALTITTGDGDISGGIDGITASNIGSGDLTITGGSGRIAGGRNGIYATNLYSDMVIEVSGGVSGGSEDGIHAWNGQTVEIYGEVIYYGEGVIGAPVPGYPGEYYDGYYGPSTYVAIGGALSITTGAGLVEGGNRGIYALNEGTGGLTVTGGSGTIWGDVSGIVADNRNGGDVNITTTGQVVGVDAFGILAENDRYGGSISITTGSLTDWAVVAGGTGVKALNDGSGGLTIAGGTGGIYGNGTGVHAVNNNGGDLEITLPGEVISSGSDGVFARNDEDGGSLSITTGDGGVVAFGDGIKATNDGYGELTVITGGGSISGRLDGIDVASTGEGGLSVTGGMGTIIGVHTGIRASIGSQSEGNLTVSVSGDVFGQTEVGINVQNLSEGEGGSTTRVTTGAGTVGGLIHGIYGSTSAEGSFSIIVGEESLVYGELEAGIRTNQQYADAATVIAIGAGAVVHGGTAGIIATANGGDIRINNNGRIQNRSGQIADLAIFTLGGETTINNNSVQTIVGSVDLTDFDDTFNNIGAWWTGGTSYFRDGEDIVNNSGFVIAANLSGVNEATIFDSLETFNNTGVVSLVDETFENDSTAFDSLTITGEFVGGEGSRLQVDAFLGGVGSEADTLVVGSTSGVTTLWVNNTNSSGFGGLNLEGILVVNAADEFGASSAGHFELAGGSIDNGLFAYDLFFDEPVNEHLLVGLPDHEVFEFSSILTGSQSLWYLTAESWLDHEAQSANGIQNGSGNVAVWASLIGETGSTESIHNIDLFDETMTADTSFTQSTFAAVVGADYVLNGFAGGSLTFGAMGGILKSGVSFANSPTTGLFEGTTVGLHAGYVGDKVRLGGIVKYDSLSMDYDAPTLEPFGESTATVAFSTLGGEIEAGYNIMSGTTVDVEAVANYAMTDTVMEAWTLQEADIVGLGQSQRAAIGVELSSDLSNATTDISASLTIKYWNEFAGENTVTVTSFGSEFDVASSTTGSFVEIGAAIDFLQMSGFGGTFVGTWVSDGTSNSTNAQLKLSYEF